VTLETQ